MPIKKRKLARCETGEAAFQQRFSADQPVKSRPVLEPSQEHAQGATPTSGVGHPSIFMARLCAVSGLLGATIFILSLLVLHLTLSGFDWLGEYASDLANAPNGWLFSFGTISHGLGNLALAFGLWLTLDPGKTRNWGVGLFSLAAMGMLLVALFSTDPPGGPSTLEGMMHRTVAGLAFLSELAALYVFSVAFRFSRLWRPYHGFPFLLAILSTLAMTALLVAIQFGIAPGLAERLTLTLFMVFDIWAAYRLLVQH